MWHIGFHFSYISTAILVSKCAKLIAYLPSLFTVYYPYLSSQFFSFIYLILLYIYYIFYYRSSKNLSSVKEFRGHFKLGNTIPE
jgi:hypothetical protein